MMKASGFEFRYRLWLHALILVLGYFAPWTLIRRTNELEVSASNTHVWGLLSTNLMQLFPALDFLSATNIIFYLSLALLVLAALLRTWATAYLGVNIVEDSNLQASPARGPVEDGPYRHLRNPLYVGFFLHTLGICILMPRSGALFAIVGVLLIDLRLIASEEHFLEVTLGQSYESYYDRVSSLLPSLRPRVPGRGVRPRWAQAFAGEIYLWGAVLAFLLPFLIWRYNQNRMVSGLLISFGVALIVRALQPKAASPQS